jgi:hypothetical protein
VRGRRRRRGRTGHLSAQLREHGDRRCEARVADRREHDAIAELLPLALSAGISKRDRPARLRPSSRGVRIGERSLPRDFDGGLGWGWVDNRPPLRCLHGLTISAWRLGEHDRAETLCWALLWLNPGQPGRLRAAGRDQRRRSLAPMTMSCARALTVAVDPVCGVGRLRVACGARCDRRHRPRAVDGRAAPRRDFAVTEHLAREPEACGRACDSVVKAFVPDVIPDRRSKLRVSCHECG